MQGNRYVVKTIEYAYKFVVALPVAWHTAFDMVRPLLESVLSVHGPFERRRTSDNERHRQGADRVSSSALGEFGAVHATAPVTHWKIQPYLEGLGGDVRQ